MSLSRETPYINYNKVMCGRDSMTACSVAAELSGRTQTVYHLQQLK